MKNVLDVAFHLLSNSILVYFLLINSFYFLFVFLSLIGIFRYQRMTSYVRMNEIFSLPLAKPISIIAPAYNEGAGILESVHSLLSLEYPLYEVISQARLPALFHTGHSGIGSGLPGGGGIRLKFSNPMHVDDVAADFPEMPIVLAHPSFPWQDEALSIAMHKPEVYIDLSGWSPKYFPPQLVQYANTLLKDRVLFGSDYPLITPDRWLADFEQAGFKDEVRPLVLKENAARLLGLRTSTPGSP